MTRRHDLLPTLFAASFGAFLGLSLLKFGNPPIMESWVSAPTNIFEFLLGYPWPISWAYRLLALVVVVGVVFRLLYVPRPDSGSTPAPNPRHAAAPNRKAPASGTLPVAPNSPTRSLPAARWLAALPVPWLLWQFLAGTQSADAQLTAAVLKHFTACAACFYLGFLCLSRVERSGLFWLGLLCGFGLVLSAGIQQHFGGLAETRQYFYLYIYPKLKEIPVEYLKKMSSDRIFGTLFYPNALAGMVMLLLPLLLRTLWQECAGWLTPAARGFLVAVLGISGLACLYWSRSKGGWLLMLVLGSITVLRLPLGKRFKLIWITGIVLAGLAGFFWKYSGYFRKGATSVSARFDYWRAAVQTTSDKPLFGTGPGTFAIAYQQRKRPESEMSRMVHNDYLEQASDSGVIGFLGYALFIGGGLLWSYPRLKTLPQIGTKPKSTSDWQPFLLWLGVLGWSLQSLLEFGLYIPALAWPAHAFLGWLLARRSNP